MPRVDLEARRAYAKEYYQRNKDKFRVWAARRKVKRRVDAAAKRATAALNPKPTVHRSCLKCGADITHTYRSKQGQKCRPCHAEYMREYRIKNAAKLSSMKKAWKERNSEYVTARDREYALRNPERKAAARKKWARLNPGLNKAAKANNYAERIKRRPTWLSDEDKWMISEVYALAALRTEVFGFTWHVDHVIPLKGKTVSGLHVPWNLQVIPWIDNLRKGARFHER